MLMVLSLSYVQRNHLVLLASFLLCQQFLALISRTRPFFWRHVHYKKGLGCKTILTQLVFHNYSKLKIALFDATLQWLTEFLFMYQYIIIIMCPPWENWAYMWWNWLLIETWHPHNPMTLTDVHNLHAYIAGSSVLSIYGAWGSSN